MDVREVFDTDRPVIGMVHLPALPGAPGFDGDRTAIRESARRDARALAAGGVDAVLVENFGDAPFYPDRVPRHVVASMTALVGVVTDEIDLPVGVNVLRNDAPSAVAVAAATGAKFVRANVHLGARVADQGILEGRAHETARLRERLAADVAVLVDVDSKHSHPLAGDLSPRDLVERGRADGVVVTGDRTGEAVDVADLEAVAAARDDAGYGVPVMAGSGVTPGNVGAVLDHADGVIAGTALKEGGDARNPVDEGRVRALVEAAKG